LSINNFSANQLLVPNKVIDPTS